MTDIVWGEPIEGKRPDWLTDGDQIVKNNIDVEVSASWWQEQFAPYRLPADHPAYLALAKDFVPWGGGDEAPADWDGQSVLFRNGLKRPGGFWSWSHSGDEGDIIGYRKRTEQPAPAIAPELVERMVKLLRDAAEHGSVVSRARAILAELEPADPDMELAKSIAGDVEAIALAIKAARENGK